MNKNIEKITKQIVENTEDMGTNIYYSEYNNHINEQYDNIYDAMMDINNKYHNDPLVTSTFPGYEIAIFSDIFSAINALSPDYIELIEKHNMIIVNTYQQEDQTQYIYFPLSAIDDSLLEHIMRVKENKEDVRKVFVNKYFLT